MTQERFFKEMECSKAFSKRVKDLGAEYPNHNYEILSQLATLLYPKLARAANGDFEDDFDLKTYAEDEPEFESPADELAHRAKIYSLEKQVDYEKATAIILEQDPDLAERYKMS